MGALWNLPLPVAVRGQAQAQADPGVVAEVAAAPGIQPIFVDPPAAHTIVLVTKLQNRGLASSDGARLMPLRPLPAEWL